MSILLTSRCLRSVPLQDTTKPFCTIPECKELHMEWLPHVLHALPCKKETDVGSVNVVRECEGWKIPKDSWMELDLCQCSDN
jgi:hypothetical protein